MSPAGGAFTVLLLVQWATVMSQDMSPSPMPDFNMTFPAIPQNFEDVAKKLMTKCSKQGYPPPHMMMMSSMNSTMTGLEERMGNPFFLFPAVLSSLLPLSGNQTQPQPNMTDHFQMNMSMTMTEKMWNCTNLPHMISIMRNATEKDYCFMRAFLAPLSWASVLQNSSQFSSEQMGLLLWAAKPLLEATPPSPLSLPPTLLRAHLVEMMKLFSDVFSSLSEKQRDQIRQWMKDRIAENDPLCQTNQTQPRILSPASENPSSPPNKPGPVTDTPNPPNGPSSGCPRMPWLKAEALRMMGRFVSRMSESDIKAIVTEELCKFFHTPEFPYSFTKPDGMQPSIGRMLLQRLKRECSSSDQVLPPQMERLGSLICFFDDASSLNSSQSKTLLMQLGDCDNTDNDQMKRDLAKKVLADIDAPVTREFLKSLGSSVSVLPPSKLTSLTADDLRDGLSSLSQAKWTLAQAKVLAKKLLDKNITGESLLSLGSMVIGVDVEQLRKCKGLEGMLKNEGMKNMTEKMSFLQKMALVEGMRSSLNASDLVKNVPDSLLPVISLFILEKAGIVSVDQVEGRSWSRTQSVYIMKKVLGEGIKREYVRKLGQAVQGVTCSMVNNVSQNDTMEIVQTLTSSSNWLSRTQMSCIAQKLFQTLEKQRAGYFINITDSELQAIPALLLIQLPIKSIQGLPASVCPRFLEKMSQTNLSSLPNSSPSRRELRDRALRCLGKNASALSTSEVLSLGPLVCELDPAWMSSLSSAVLNSTLQALSSCFHIPRANRAPLFKLITGVYGDQSVWSEDVIKLLGPLVLLNETAVEIMPSKSWMKSLLSDLLDGIQSQPAASAPEEFRLWPNLLALRQKLFQLKTSPTQQRRRRAVALVLQPYTSLIEDLKDANVYWSPTQLSNMTALTFRETVQVLGEIRNYTTDQLAALRMKVHEVYANVSNLDQPQIVELGCISQGFTTKEQQSLNITSLDTLKQLSACQWNQTQIATIWQSFAERTKTKMADLRAVEMVGLGNFICGLQSDQIDQLNTTEFKEAVEDVGKAACSLTVLESLKKKAVAALGLPKSWGEPEVCVMGNIIAGLNSTELASMNSSVLPFIRQQTIPLISPDRLAALSITQLKALGPDNAAMITASQRSALRVDQRAAVDEALGVATPRTETSTSAPIAVPQKAGAAERSVFGIAVLPAVLVMLGFIL
ncbi:otoancorin [Astyanax mexicanus]|uniref:otoancorin n=1 Tax=Astyanax mexicanus TaxID=7994 RepID=UPI0020CAF025|nr:otoancorin [Astyanax mexicanus]